MLCFRGQQGIDSPQGKVRVSDKQTYVGDLRDGWPILLFVLTGKLHKHKEAFVLAICRACSHFTETDFVVENCMKFTLNVSWEVWLVF